jgi:hypothetical protein
MSEPTQSFEKHTKFVPLYHFTLLPLILVTLIGSVVNLKHCYDDQQGVYGASLITVLAFALFLTAFLARVFPLKAQDRAIRAEENLRHYVLTGKLLDRRLTLAQIIGLRFASDAEFPALAEKAADTSMSQKDIKQAIKTWKPDHDRL